MHITRVCARLPRLQIQFRISRSFRPRNPTNLGSKIRFWIRRKDYIPMIYHDPSNLGLGSPILIRIIPERTLSNQMAVPVFYEYLYQSVLCIIADHVTATRHNIKWDHFEILESGRTDYHCKIKETLFVQDLKPASNVNLTSLVTFG